MDPVTLEVIKWIVMGGVGIIMWFMRNTVTTAQTEIKDLKQDVDFIKREYLSKNDFKDFKIELREMFNEIKTDIRELKSHNGT